MPLINEFGNQVVMVLYTKKQHVKLYDSAFVNPVLVSEQIKNGEGIFSGLGSLITSGVNFATANKDLIQAGIQSTGSIIQAGKNINDAVNSTRKVNAEIDALKKVRKHIEALNREPVVSNNSSTRVVPTPLLSQDQEKALKESLKSIPKPRGKGFRIY